ncbi:MAG TPA: C40 family peptidase [Gemmatimonadales bacterium]|nr:C40 family peptidase [Gemmatimonadales bacterium]
MRLRTDRALIASVAFAAASPLSGQQAGRDLDFLYGRWYQGNQSTSYELRTDAPLAGIFSHGLAAQVLVHDSLGRNHAFYGAGWQLHALRHRSAFGPYGIAGVSLGLSTDTTAQDLAALWTIGGGLEWRPAPWVAFGLEGVYRLQDIGPRGFWRASADSRGGVAAALGLSLAIGRSRSGAGGGTPQPEPEPPSEITGNAADVVRSALAVLGTPYVWGGSAENGFDCSGLVQWAYRQHGIRLPRTSRDQAGSGSLITPVIEALHPGDILLFAAQPGGGVTHVGMYVGNQTFIHSAKDGVKLSRLESTDTDGAWWVARWVGARRVVE